ncbi:ADP-ribosylation/Crystallin J1 [Pseudocohnilembus persalinus]|uniref:ADP-ribosylhydrolase ARH3 n=1 Tax=Pseudocohnilembus persalinus TaxID=266149 RepID=A0A0V0QNE1_PSEPJ|nr:ADP-ribosylation/Crystallin J1 [Pseudocohnilembus persalinus]|eukprot:KRX03709.1 ADP-ribosylation/Crystallin J1 [Pseudocohnilembus persalinus]
MVMGSLLGDALGTHTEFFNFDAKKQDINQNWDSLIQFIEHNLKMGYIKKQRTEFGVHSDDFSMAKCVADSFIENDYNFDPVDMRKRFALWWYFGLNNGFEGNRSFGLGREINQGFQKIINEGKVNKYVIDEGKLEQMTDVSGNGSVMRLAYIPILYREELEKGEYVAKYHSLTTHSGNEAYDLCGLLTYLCINLLQYPGNSPQRDIFTTKLKQYKTQIPSIKAFAYSQKESFNSLKNYNIQFNQNELDRYWDWKDEKLVVSQTRLNIDATYFGSYSMDSAYLAMHASYHSKSQVEAIFRAVNFKGDSDSVASIVGYITGAMYGLSPEIIKLYNDKCLQYDQFQSLIRAYMIHYQIKFNK